MAVKWNLNRATNVDFKVAGKRRPPHRQRVEKALRDAGISNFRWCLGAHEEPIVIVPEKHRARVNAILRAL